MPVPNTKIYLSTTALSGGGFRFLPNAAGDLSNTLVGIPNPAWLSAITDLNGDGVADVIVGAPGDDDKDVDAGRIFVHLGPIAPGSTSTLSDAATDIKFDGIAAGDRAGAAVGFSADMNGDGLAEILIGIPGKDIGTDLDAGIAIVAWGVSAPGGIDLEEPFVENGNGFAILGEAA